MSAKTSRRQFVKDALKAVPAAAGFPYIAPSTVFGKSGAVESSNRIVMGCIGLGIRGTALVRAFLSHKAVQIVAVCDVYKSQRQKAKQIEKVGGVPSITHSLSAYSTDHSSTLLLLHLKAAIP